VTNSDDALTPCKRKLACHRRVGSYNFLTDYAGRWLAAKCVHIFYKSAQLFKVVRDLWRGYECALATTNLDKTAAYKILNSPTDGYATDPESRNEVVFGRELVADLQVSIGNFASEDRFDARVEKRLGRKVRSSRLHVLPSQCNEAFETEGTKSLAANRQTFVLGTLPQFEFRFCPVSGSVATVFDGQL